MTKAQHTPGFWFVAQGRVCAQDGTVVCDARSRHAEAERDANARLIAAAPELLAALEKTAAVFGWQSPNANPTVDAAIAAARAAIAKAKGA